jgi:hypothetical protein
LSSSLLSRNLILKLKKNIILPAVLCETWSLTLRKGHKLRVYENMELKRIYGPKSEKWAIG